MLCSRPEILVRGDSSLLSKSPTVILNSRQSKTPAGSDPWVANTVQAVKSVIDNRSPIITSIGMNTWELVLWASGEYGGRAIILCPRKPDTSIEETIIEISVEYNLIPEEHAWVFIPVAEKSRSEKSWWLERDRLAVEIAENIFSVSIKGNGNLSELIEIAEKIDGKSIDNRCKVEYKSDSHGKPKLVIPESCPVFENWYHLTHWTCRTYKPWPGESSADFYRAIANSDAEYPRSASQTLKRILSENRIRASGRRIRDGIQVVSFTSLEPVDALKLMKWRKRYVRPTFEPYGIAIFYRSAMQAGIRMVTYVKNGEVQIDSDVAPELSQGYGTGDWPKEQEWRSVGDVDLSKIPEEDVVVLVPSKEEAEEFRKLTRFRVMPLE